MRAIYKTFLAAVPVLLTVSACTQNKPIAEKHHRETKNEYFTHINKSETDVEKDRTAILAMQGEYKVSFDFKETVILASNYQRFPEKKAEAFETVIVVEDSPNRIVMQHLLTIGKDKVVKHWRQDWVYQADKRLEFSADQTWRMKSIDNSLREGFWTQCVYEVSDAPRYCGTGKWDHLSQSSTWTSDATWRPLPRRDYTIREDYNALLVINRHTVTNQGWTHEQDNAKVIRAANKIQKTLVREFGFNDYRRISGHDFTPAYSYWERTSPYWEIVRKSWSERIDNEGIVILNTAVDGMPLIEATFSHADSIENGDAIPTKTTVDNMLDQWINSSFDQVGLSHKVLRN